VKRVSKEEEDSGRELEEDEGWIDETVREVEVKEMA